VAPPLDMESVYKGTGFSVWRRIFSFPVLLMFLLSALAVMTVRGRFDDPDMWWHLKVGQIIWSTHKIPVTDIFSYTTGHHAWVPHEWLAQTLIYLAYRLDGYSGLMLWLCVVSAALLIAAYALCTLYSGNAKVAFLGAMTIWLFATTGLAIRPQMIGYLLLVVELLLLQMGRIHSPRWFFGLPPLFALWVNCHGSFFLGLVVGATVLFATFCDFRLGLLVAIPWEPARRRILAGALALSVPALLLNPAGIQQILYPLNAMFGQPVGAASVQEWMPLEMTTARGIALMAVLGGIFFIVIARRAEIFWEELMLLALGTWLAVSHQRMLFVFGILAAPILTRIFSTSWDGYDAARDLPWANAALIVASVFVMVLAFPGSKNLATQVEENSPVQAVNYIHAHRLSGNMMNDYGYGGYLIWAAPDHPVFVDGRADVFEWTGILTEVEKWATLTTNPNTLLDKHNIDLCLLARTSPMANVLPLLPGWKAVYSDRLAVIFVRTGSQPHPGAMQADGQSRKAIP
jgi:hypothetical protein